MCFWMLDTKADIPGNSLCPLRFDAFDGMVLRFQFLKKLLRHLISLFGRFPIQFHRSCPILLHALTDIQHDAQFKLCCCMPLFDGLLKPFRRLG